MDGPDGHLLSASALGHLLREELLEVAQFVDPAEHVPSAQEMAEAAEANSKSSDDDDSDEPTGPDPVEAKSGSRR